MTGEWGTSDTFYKAPDNKYYKTKELYEEQLKQKKAAQQVRNIINSDFLKKQNMPPSKVASRELKRLMQYYNATDIKDALDDAYEDIDRILGYKEFSSEYGCVRYIFAIIQSRAEENQRMNRKKADHKAWLNHDYEFMEEESTERMHQISVMQQSKAKDISMFLEEDEL